jgi:hypothetical protein
MAGNHEDLPAFMGRIPQRGNIKGGGFLHYQNRFRLLYRGEPSTFGLGVGYKIEKTCLYRDYKLLDS